LFFNFSSTCSVLGVWLTEVYITRVLLQIIDTVLAKLFARGEKTTDLYALLDELDIIILPEVEPIFRATGRYSKHALQSLFKTRT
jgi:hypothetical protein